MFSFSISLPAYASMDGNNMMKNEKMLSMNDIESPHKQLKHGVLAHNVKCKTGFSLVLKLADSSPACVKQTSLNRLVTIGWTSSENNMIKIMNQNTTQNMQGMMNLTMANDTMKEDKGMAMNLKNKSMTETMPEAKMKMPNESPQTSQPDIDQNHYRNAPALVGISDYINTTPAKLAQDMKGKVIVYDFWTFNCINCIHTLPHVVDLHNKYLGKVLVIGIHSPETLVEKDPNNVRDAVHRYNTQYPVVTDNEFQTWNAFGNHYWPISISLTQMAR